MNANKLREERLRKLAQLEAEEEEASQERKHDNGPDQMTQAELLRMYKPPAPAAAPRQGASSGSGIGAGKKIGRSAAAAAAPTPSLAINEQVVIDKVGVVQVDVGSASDFTAIAAAMTGDAASSSGAVQGRATRLKTPVKPKKASSKRDSSRTRAAPKTDREAAIEQMGRITALLDETSATWLGQFKARLESAIAANDAASIEATIVEDAAHFEQDPGVHRLLQADEQLRDEMTARLERVAKIRAKQLKLA